MKNIKKIVLVSLVVVMLLSMSIYANAADGNLIFKGGADKFVVTSGTEEYPTDLFPDLKDVMPGDTLNQKITVFNDEDSTLDIEFSLRSLGGTEDTVDFLNLLTLVIMNGETEIYNGPAGETGTLENWVVLAELEPGDSMDLDLTLTVPLDLDDEYQDFVGLIDWELKADEIPDDPPPTGQLPSIWIYTIVFAGCAGLLVIMFVIKKKTEKKQ